MVLILVWSHLGPGLVQWGERGRGRMPLSKTALAIPSQQMEDLHDHFQPHNEHAWKNPPIIKLWEVKHHVIDVCCACKMWLLDVYPNYAINTLCNNHMALIPMACNVVLLHGNLLWGGPSCCQLLTVATSSQTSLYCSSYSDEFYSHVTVCTHTHTHIHVYQQKVRKLNLGLILKLILNVLLYPHIQIERIDPLSQHLQLVMWWIINKFSSLELTYVATEKFHYVTAMAADKTFISEQESTLKQPTEDQNYSIWIICNWRHIFHCTSVGKSKNLIPGVDNAIFMVTC